MSNNHDENTTRREFLGFLSAGTLAYVLARRFGTDPEQIVGPMGDTGDLDMAKISDGEIETIPVVQNIDNLEEPELYPALAFTADQGWVFFDEQ